MWAAPDDDAVGLSALRKAGSGQELHNCSLFMRRNGLKGGVMKDLIEELNAIGMTPFSRRFCFSHKRMQLYVLVICSDKHIQVQLQKRDRRSQ